MPALFIGHGNPMNAIEENRYSSAWQSIGRLIPRPRAVLCISAHWCTQGTAVSAAAKPETLHDFSGFPHFLNEYTYAAPGDPALAAQIQALLAPTAVVADMQRGLDHGCWSILTHLFPEADIPVVQLSLDVTQPFGSHYQLGAQLAPLRDEGVLLLGSGNVVHNLQALRMGEDSPPYPWATRIEQRVRECIEHGEHAALIDYPTLDPDMRHAVPTPDHFVPLLYVLGAQRENDQAKLLLKGIDLGSISMLSVLIGKEESP